MKALLSISFITLFLVGCGADVLRETDTETQTTNLNTVASDPISSDTGVPPVETSITDSGLPIDTGSGDSVMPVDTGSSDTGFLVDTGSSDTGLPLDTGSVDTGFIDTGSTDTGQPVDTGTIDTDTRPSCDFVCITKGTCPASGIGSAGIPHREMSCGDDSKVCCDDHSQDPTLPACIYTCDMGLACGPSYEYVPDMVCPTQDGAVFTCCKALFDTDNPVDTGTVEPVDTGTGDPTDTGTGDPVKPYCSYSCVSPDVCPRYNGTIHTEEVCDEAYFNNVCCELPSVNTDTGDPIDTDTGPYCNINDTEDFEINSIPEGWVGDWNWNNEPTLSLYKGHVQIVYSNGINFVRRIATKIYTINECSSIELSFLQQFNYDLSCLKRGVGAEVSINSFPSGLEWPVYSVAHSITGQGVIIDPVKVDILSRIPSGTTAFRVDFVLKSGGTSSGEDCRNFADWNIDQFSIIGN